MGLSMDSQRQSGGTHRDVACTHGALISLQTATCFRALDVLSRRDFSSVWRCWSKLICWFSLKTGEGR